ncbi:hypothetical protein AGMMS50225_20410 [Betaproteobacteria bacterium]|nr:hypothetical protein AGMMS50225_20410 [Betaproteobacteria bacterium]
MNEKRKNMLIKIAQRENLNLVEEHVIADTTQAIAFDPNKRKFVYVTFATGDYLVHDISDILSWKVSRFQITQGNQYGSGEMYTLDISVADTSHPLLKLVAGGITGQARANGWSAYLEAIVNGNATGASSVKAKNIND